MTLRIVVLFINHVIRREFVKALRFPYLRSEIFSDERGVQIGHPISISGSFQKCQ